jgi:hypothetical protein
LPVVCDSHKIVEGWGRALVWPAIRGGLVDGFRNFTEKCRADFASIVENKKSDSNAVDRDVHASRSQ